MSGLWTEHCDAAGRVFYFNMRTQKSTWIHPDLQELVAAQAQPAPQAAHAQEPPRPAPA